MIKMLEMILTSAGLLRKPALVALCAGLAAGCAAHGSLRGDLYAADGAEPKTSASVVLVRQPGPPPSLRHKELPWVSAEIDLKGYPQAVAAMLGSLYDRVSVTTAAAQAQGADFVVLMGTDYPRTVGLTFQDGSGKILADFVQPGLEVPNSPDADSLLAKIMTPPALVVSFGTLGAAFAYQAHDAAKHIGSNLSDATAKALMELRRQIASAPALMRGLPAAAVAEPSPKPSARCEPTPAAREIFDRAQSYLGVATTVEDYATAAAEFEKAAAAAPCWPSAQLSCALAEEGAHRWGRAAGHLRAYLDLSGDVPEAGKIRERIAGLESHEERAGR